MITTRMADSNDAAAIAGAWNARAAQPTACLYGAQQFDEAAVQAVLADGCAAYLVEDGGELLGFCLARGGQVLGMCSPTAEVYYHAMAAFASAAAGQTTSCEIAARDTDEMTWMNALGVVSLSPIGYTALAEGDDPESREVTVYLATADAAALKSAAATTLENL